MYKGIFMTMLSWIDLRKKIITTTAIDRPDQIDLAYIQALDDCKQLMKELEGIMLNGEIKQGKDD